MPHAGPVPANIDEYIAGFPADVQQRLQSIRQAVRNAAPDAEEEISYRMPTFALRGNLIHFAAFKRHIGLYPGAAAIAALREDLAGYRTSKGAVQLPLDRPLPLGLVEKIVQFRIEDGLRRAKDSRAG
jgi:uncharacterized protein YdhG (YjbR/CyaY superfamily)